MRNFKKILSLVLALAMMLSVMVVGAGAAFSDEAEFSAEYVTSAEALTNLGVLKGYEDGSFQPKDTITRAETAALIYRMATGDVADAQTDIYTKMTNGFSDVDNSKWYAGYINFCANAQYILGMGDGTFGPQKNVTGYQTLAMILRAAGFDKDGQFAGPNWEVNTASFAEKLGVLENVKGTEDLGAPATRELVAELLFATMSKVELVHYAPAWGYAGLGQTLGEKQFKLAEIEGVVYSNEVANLSTTDSAPAEDAGETVIVFAEGSKVESATYKLSTGLDIIGEQVTFWASDDTAISTPISKADTTTEWSNTTYAELDKDAKADYKEAIKDHFVYSNYDVDSNQVPANGKGIYVKVIDNGEGFKDFVLTETAYLTAVDTINTAGDVKLANKTSAIKAENVVVASDVAAGDIVLAINIEGVTYIEKASSFTGIVSGYSTKGEDTASIGGEAYYVSVLANKAGLADFDDVKDTYQPGADWNGTYYTYYQDAYGNIIAYEKAGENATDYALILDYDVYKTGAFQGDLTWKPLEGINAGDLYVKYLTADNKVETAKVNLADSKIFTPENIQDLKTGKHCVGVEVNVGDVVEYTINADGEFTYAYTFDYVETFVETDTAKNLARVGDSPELFNVNDELVVFYYTTVAELEDGFVSPAGNTLMENVINLVKGILDPATPIYGVLTGDEAIADLDSYYAKTVHQMDAVAGTSNHTNKFVGEADMFNIRGIINPFVDYCYVADYTEYTSEQIDDEYFRTYDAVNSKGEAIEVTVELENAITAADCPIFAYLTLNVMGEEVNLLVDVCDAQFVTVYAADLHEGNAGIEIYVAGDETGFLAEDVVCDVYANVDGGTATLSAEFCTGGYAVMVDGEVVAVFVTDVADADYVCEIPAACEH